jgi:hypothetical protein
LYGLKISVFFMSPRRNDITSETLESALSQELGTVLSYLFSILNGIPNGLTQQDIKMPPILPAFKLRHRKKYY